MVDDSGITNAKREEQFGGLAADISVELEQGQWKAPTEWNLIKEIVAWYAVWSELAPSGSPVMIISTYQ